MKLRYQIIFLLLFLLFSEILISQQTVRGTITDKASGFPLEKVNIVLLPKAGKPDSKQLFVASDKNGNFTLKNVPYGRNVFQIQRVGYKTKYIPNVLITSGKESFLNIELQEALYNLKEVKVVSKKKEDRIGSIAKVSALEFKMENVNRFSGGRLDVARMVRNFPGVVGTDDARNDIVIRGNSPTGVLWRLGGIPIPNPNHFSTSGTTGGPVSVINSNFLKNSTFLTGAFPATYGNATAGVFDIEFRNGNKNKFEGMFQLNATSGFQGLVEGPIGKKNQASFLIGYRYSFTGAFGLKVGTGRAVPKYQDLTFKLNTGRTKLGEFSWFGIGGLSNIDFLASTTETSGFSNPNKDLYNISKLGMTGLSHKLFLGTKSYIKSTALLSGTLNNVDIDRYKDATKLVSKYQVLDLTDRTTKLAFTSFVNTKINSKLSIRNGVICENTFISNFVKSRDNLPKEYVMDKNGDGLDDFITFSDFNGNISLLQAYTEGTYRINDKLTYYLGLHGQYSAFNSKSIIEPRTNLSWQIRSDHAIKFAYGLHSQTQPFLILLLKDPLVGDKLTNKDLGFSKSHHFVLEYDWKFLPNWSLKSSIYYQYVFNVAVEKNKKSSYSTINEGASFTFRRKNFLVNEGTGRNYGLEVTLDRSFENNFYSLITGTFYSSKYKGSDGILRNSAFNGGYTINFLGGKEFPIKDFIVLTFNTKVTFAGGRYYTPIDVNATIANNGSPVYQEDQAYSKQYDPYFRLDMKVGFRINHKKTFHEFFADFINITNHKNVFLSRYNDVKKDLETVYQLGFFLDILYRFRF